MMVFISRINCRCFWISLYVKTEWLIHNVLNNQVFYRGAFSSRARRLAWIPSFSSYWEASGPVIYLRSLGSGRSERLLSRRRSRETEIFERDGEIERDGKGKYETRLGLFSVPPVLSFLLFSLVCFCYLPVSLWFHSFGSCMKAHRTDIAIVQMIVLSDCNLGSYYGSKDSSWLRSFLRQCLMHETTWFLERDTTSNRSNRIRLVKVFKKELNWRMFKYTMSLHILSRFYPYNNVW